MNIIVVKQAAKKFVVEADGQVTSEAFRTKREAEQEAERQREEAAEFSPEAIAAMDKVTRLGYAKQERIAVKEWEAAGGDTDRPATPVLDWMNSTPAEVRNAKKGKAPKGERTAAVALTDADVITWISEQAKADAPTTLRAFRDSGRSCAQARFRTLRQQALAS